MRINYTVFYGVIYIHIQRNLFPFIKNDFRFLLLSSRHNFNRITSLESENGTPFHRTLFMRTFV